MTPVWSSPHNTLLQILAEAGLPGALIAVAAALRWGLAVLSRLRGEASSTVWWSLAGVGIVAIHSLLEYPLWYAHFLLLAALAAGMVARPVVASPAAWRPASFAFALACAVLLVWALRDYSRYDRTYVIATGRTLAPAAETAQALDELRAIAAGPLGAEVAPWLYRWSPQQPGDRWASVEAGKRALRRLPDPELVQRLRAQGAALPAQ
jgi:O-antigen ligase